MKKKTVITLLFVLPILVNCQNIDNTQTDNLEIDSMFFDQNKQDQISEELYLMINIRSLWRMEMKRFLKLLKG